MSINTIQIESVLGGQSPTSHFGSVGQFRSSLGIDPALPAADADTVTTAVASGLLRPVATEKLSSNVLVDVPMWIITQPKLVTHYVYDLQGSAYSISQGSTSLTALSDGGTLTSSTGNGAAYYDNYIYFAKSADVSRYGPLNGVAAFTGTYWTGTLGKTALTNTAYPASSAAVTSGTKTSRATYPNHILHRHSDGRLYIADVVGNQGAVHFIQTKFTSVEGDTDDGSTYGKLLMGYGLWPTALESYGTDLVIALMEGNSGTQTRFMPAKIAFWDTVSQNINKIIWVEFPDPMISAMKNINGVLYVFSGNPYSKGFRVSRFVGGYTVEEVAYVETGITPYAGAVSGTAHRLLFGSWTATPEVAACVYSYGLQKKALGEGIFNTMRINGSTSSTSVYSLAITEASHMGFSTPVVGWSEDSTEKGGLLNGLDKRGTTYSNAPAVWWSGVYRIGQPFKITKIRIPLAQAVTANMTVTPTIYTDDGTSTALTAINNTNYSGNKNIVIRPNGLTGQHNFWLELKWSGSALCVINLPITIEYELLDD